MRVLKLVLCAILMTGCAKPELSMPILTKAVAQDASKSVSLVMPNINDYIRKKRNLRLKKVSFSDLPGWKSDNQHEAMIAFITSCKKILSLGARGNTGKFKRPKHMKNICQLAVKLSKSPDKQTSRMFFETYFVPYKVNSTRKHGLLTGYYEPEILGSVKKTDKFNLPIYKTPRDLVQLQPYKGVGRKLGGVSTGRKTSKGIVAFPTRKEIDLGALNGQGLELVYLSDPVDAFFLHIQGSGRIKLTDGSTMAYWL